MKLHKDWLRILLVGLLSLVIGSGCASTYSSHQTDEPSGYKLYVISESYLLDLMEEALEPVFPSAHIVKLKGKRKGFHIHVTFALDSHDYSFTVKKQFGTKLDGKEVGGHNYTIDDKGSMLFSPSSNKSRFKSNLDLLLQENNIEVAIVDSIYGKPKLAPEKTYLAHLKKTSSGNIISQPFKNDNTPPSIVENTDVPAQQVVPGGTGFLFSSKDYVITNWHVIRGMKSIKVMFLNGEKINATVLLKDAENDIAFLKLEQSPQLPASEIRIGDSSKMRMGDEVFTIGYPAHQILGMNPKYTKGEVNAVSGISDDPRVFQVSVQIQPGNSGGPLFNSKGEVIGITQASLDPKVAMGTFGTLPQNVNYAIKSSYIANLLPMLPETMIASRGIVVVPADPENNLANFIDKVKKNIVLIEATE